jgi:hypothetical protein
VGSFAVGVFCFIFYMWFSLFVKKFLELKNKLKPLCKNFVDFGDYLSENIELD